MRPIRARARRRPLLRSARRHRACSSRSTSFSLSRLGLPPPRRSPSALSPAAFSRSGRSGSRRARRIALPLAVLLIAATGACGGDKSDTPSPFAGCGSLAKVGAGAPAPDLPDVTIPCFTGGEPVALRSLRGPAVINLWASWCDPCRRELPVIQRLADTAGDKITVIGVDVGDGREAGASFAADKGVTMPMLLDPDRKLLNALAGVNLPITVFVDAAGKAYVNRLPLDADKLTDMVREHAGVTVAL